MILLIMEDNWFIRISQFMGGSGIFLVIAIILLIVVGYNKWKSKR
ncbi:hypothetical protein [Nonlabens ulvanivorans]|uniref:Uncharacterized protein n=1 Tax=Nonlabens ulvanivorans TaxID=906888 RepID=A0ABX5EAC5_NONUL|nr:hypothetical protein [Nonlabens ulvanivorans]PRX15079.1 hypothetical protein LY02_00292 [Nonlabens ulvanivorans]